MKSPQSIPRAREVVVARMLVDVADAVIDGLTAEELLEIVAERCAELLGGSTEVSVVFQDGADERAVIAASSEAALQLATFEAGGEQNPSSVARTTGEESEHDVHGDVLARPRLSAIAEVAGITRIRAYPLVCGGRLVGAISIFTGDDNEIPSGDIALVQAVGDVAATAILQLHMTRGAVLLATQLQEALDGRVIIEQAKGMIAISAGIAVDEAFQRLRRYARDNNVNLKVVAAGVVEGTLSEDAMRRLVGGRRPPTEGRRGPRSGR